MNKPNLSQVNYHLYRLSEENMRLIIQQKNRQIQQLKQKVGDVQVKNKKIEELEERLGIVLKEKNARIKELEEQNYAFKQQIKALLAKIQPDKQKIIQKLQMYQQKQRLLEEKNFEEKLIKESFWWGGSWSELQTKKEELNLSQGSWNSLPEKLYTLKNLIKLQASKNNLRSLPEKISDLKKLQKLDLGFNQLAKLPQSLGNLRELTLLYLHYNQLTELPQSLGNLSKLQQLYICYNPNLKELPKSFKNLKELNALLIDWQLLPRQNIFKTEPFASLKNIQKLYIWNLDSDGNQRKEAIKKECEKNKIKVQFR